jgi:hypothetical protein
MPRLADYVLSSSPNPPFADSSLTAFFHRQSNGRFTLYGDVHGLVTRGREEDYRLRNTDFLDRGRLTQEILEHLRPRVDFSQYDANDDGFVDHIFVVVRNFNTLVLFQNPWVSGVSSLGHGVTARDEPLDGKLLDAVRSGSYNRYQPVDVMRDNVMLLAHEFGHDLFNSNGYIASHLNPIRGNRMPYHPPADRDHDFADRMTGYSLMQGAGSATERVWGFHLTAAERSYMNAEHDDESLRWIDCRQPVHGTTVALRDLYDFGDCTRLAFETIPRVSELFVQHVDGHALFSSPRFNPSVIDSPCPGCHIVEGGMPVNGLLIELSQRNAEMPFRAVRDVVPADNALRRPPSCDLAMGIGPRLAETFKDDLWRPDNSAQLTPWTRPNVYGYTFGNDVPPEFFESGWHVLDRFRYQDSAGGRRAMAFDYFREPFDLDRFVFRADSWMGRESDGLAFNGRVSVASGVTLVIEEGATVHFRGGLDIASGGRVELRGGARALGPAGERLVR